MPKFYVGVKEVYEQMYEAEANSQEQALQMIERNLFEDVPEVRIIEDNFVYCHTQEADTWNVHALKTRLKRFDIWAEGFRATGEYAHASKMGISSGINFKDACNNLAKVDVLFREYYSSNRLTHWDCKLFDNEDDARKSFG